MSRGQVRLSQTIDASPEIVFRYLTDVDRSPEWDPTVKQVTIMTRGPLRKGTILRGTIELEGQDFNSDDEVTEFEPPWRLAIRSVQGGVDGIGYSLSLDDQGRTRLDVALSYDLPDPPPDSGLDGAAVRRELVDGLSHSIEALKTLIERETAPPT